jgi:hypothetical protein
MVANRMAGAGARESTRQQRRHTRLASLRGCGLQLLRCSRSAGSTRVLGVAVLRPHRIAIARLRPALGPVPGGKTNTFFPFTQHNIERLQALGVVLRSGSIGLGLTVLARLMVVLRAERGRGIFEVASGRGIFEVASEKRDAQETAEPAPPCITNIAPLENICRHWLVQIMGYLCMVEGL